MRDAETFLRQEDQMYLRRAALVLAAAIAAVAAVGVLPATAAPATSHPVSCAQGHANTREGQTPVWVCEQLFSSGRELISSQGWMYERGDGFPVPNVHIELVYPNGHLIKNCRATTLRGGRSIPRCEWTPRSTRVPHGRYCSIGWFESLPGRYDKIAEACVRFNG
jgi:hypothetical protein